MNIKNLALISGVIILSTLATSCDSILGTYENESTNKNGNKLVSTFVLKIDNTCSFTYNEHLPNGEINVTSEPWCTWQRNATADFKNVVDIRKPNPLVDGHVSVLYVVYEGSAMKVKNSNPEVYYYKK